MATAQPATRADVREEGQAAERRGEGRPIDLVHLSRYTLGNREIEQEVLEMFRGQSRRMLARLTDARDVATWQIAAHTLKGSAKGIGAWSVAWAAEAAEGLAGGPDSGEAHGALDRLSGAIEECCTFIDAILAAD